MFKTTFFYMAALFISIGRMPFLALTLDTADSLIVLVITKLISGFYLPPGFYLHQVEVVNQEPASGSLKIYATIFYTIIFHKILPK